MKPGQATNFIFPYAMHEGMGGKHHFEVHISTNDRERPKLVFHIYANSLEPSAAEATAPRPAKGGYYDLPVKGLKTAMAQKNFTLVNVHIPFEGRIQGTDLEIPYNEIDKALNRLPKAKNAPIVLYCSSGRMSEIAAKRLAELGYTRVFNVVGGMVAWQEAGYPLETK
ncbi:MAG: rhodanese-like domain-containing protein [Bacillota bacterium]